MAADINIHIDGGVASSAVIFTIENRGAADLTITGLSIAGDTIDFGLTYNMTAVIAPASTFRVPNLSRSRRTVSNVSNRSVGPLRRRVYQGLVFSIRSGFPPIV